MIEIGAQWQVDVVEEERRKSKGGVKLSTYIAVAYPSTFTPAQRRNRPIQSHL